MAHADQPPGYGWAMSRGDAMRWVYNSIMVLWLISWWCISWFLQHTHYSGPQDFQHLALVFGISALASAILTLIALVFLVILAVALIFLGIGFHQVWPLAFFFSIVGFLDLKWEGLVLGALLGSVVGIIWIEIRARMYGEGLDMNARVKAFEQLPTLVKNSRLG